MKNSGEVTIETQAKEEKKTMRERKPKLDKTKSKAKPLSHPPYFQMIKEAITALSEKGGSSPYAIAKYMEENHKKELPSNFRKILGLQLKNSVTKGKLVKVKASYKLSISEAGKPKQRQKRTLTRAARANAGRKTRALSNIHSNSAAKQSKRAAKPKQKQLKSIN